jgi:hypothetical protein
MIDDIVANCDCPRQPRDFEARMLVELLHLSRVTVLYGGEGVGKTTLLKTGVLPLLRARPQDRNPARNVKPPPSPAFSEHHAEDGTNDGAVIAIVFDRWTSAPLVALQSQISDVLRRERVPLLLPRPSVAANLAAWNRKFGVRFFILLDAFEQYLHAPLHRADIGEFDEEFVRIVNDPFLPVHFLLSVRDEAEGLMMSRFQRRISGFSDAFVRLPRITLPADRWKAQPAFPNESAEPPRPLAVPENAKAKAEVERKVREEAEATTRRTATSPVRTEFRARVRSLGRQLTAIGAGFAMVVGAGYFAMYGYHGNPTQQIASSAKDATPVTRHAADASTITAASASRADDFVPPPLSPPRSDDVARTPQVRKSVSPRRSPPIESAAASPPPDDAALTMLQEAIPVAPAPAKTDWQTAMRAELDVCRKEWFLERVVCIEQVRWRHCAPNRWNTIPECVTGNT